MVTSRSERSSSHLDLFFYGKPEFTWLRIPEANYFLLQNPHTPTFSSQYTEGLKGFTSLLLKENQHRCVT